jgi:hypothetical protein
MLELLTTHQIETLGRHCMRLALQLRSVAALRHTSRPDVLPDVRAYVDGLDEAALYEELAELAQLAAQAAGCPLDIPLIDPYREDVPCLVVNMSQAARWTADELLAGREKTARQVVEGKVPWVSIRSG